MQDPKEYQVFICCTWCWNPILYKHNEIEIDKIGNKI